MAKLNPDGLLAQKLGTTETPVPKPKPSRAPRTRSGMPKAGAVKITRPDGTVSWRPAYNACELNRVLGQGHLDPAATPLDSREQAIARRSMP